MSDHPQNDYERYQQGSEVARFHNYPKFFGDALDNENNLPTISKKYHDWIEYLVHSEDRDLDPPAKESPERSFGAYSRHLLNVLKTIQTIPTTPGNASSLKQATELLRQDLRTVLLKISEYIMAAHRLEEVATSGDKEEIMSRDQARRLAHNALITDLNIANRTLFFAFGKIRKSSLSPTQLAMFNKQKERGGVPTEIPQLNLPQNGFCPDSINPADPQDREKITFWSAQIYADLRVLETELMTA